MLLDILQNFLVNTFSLIFVKDKGNIMATHDTKNLFMKQRSLEIRVAGMPNLSLKSRKNIHVLSLTKTIKNSFFIEELKLLKLLKESFLLRPGLLIFLF